MKKPIVLLMALLAVAVTAALAIALHAGRPTSISPVVDPPAPERMARTELDADRSIGPGRTVGRLTVFPVLHADQPDLGRFVTLDQALRDKTGEVRETDHNGSVNTLVIANTGSKSIFVLAGTIVRGGKQDRLIGQDFAVGPGQTVPVDAFCVERNRWDSTREGKPTDNRFGASKSLAPSSIRAAGQYKKDQGEVWSKVGETNMVHGKRTATGSLAASLDDQKITAQRAALARQVASYLNEVGPQSEVVGLAYAIDDTVRSVRWFGNHELYEMYRQSLFDTAAMEALTAERETGSGPNPSFTPPTAEQVKQFVAEIDSVKPTEVRSTPGENVNDYKETHKGFGSSATLKTAPSSWVAVPRKYRGKKPKLSSDYTAK